MKHLAISHKLHLLFNAPPVCSTLAALQPELFLLIGSKVSGLARVSVASPPNP